MLAEAHDAGGYESQTGSNFHFGLVCSSWVVVSRGSSLRHWLAPMGDGSRDFVAGGNKMVSRPTIEIACPWYNEIPSD